MAMGITNAEIMAEVKAIGSDVTEIKAQIQTMNGRQRGDHDKITELETKLGIWGGAQAMFTTVAAIIAGLIGIQR